MKFFWFKRKKYGWGWTFGTWESYVVMAVYLFVMVYIFRLVDNHSHSSSDTLINFAPRFLLMTAILCFICWWKGEKLYLHGHATWRFHLQVAKILERGGITVIPTDTTYGIVGSALNERAVNEIYRLRKRDLNKPLIVLIADRKDLKKFGVVPTQAQEKILDRVWPKTNSQNEFVRPNDENRFRPGPTSVVLSCPIEKFAYLHRGKNSLAFRVPMKAELWSLLREVGPLVAPSANPQGHPIAKTISEAWAYFGHHIEFYQDGGTITASPSRIIDITDGTEKVLR